MVRRHRNYRLAKIHRSYTIEELASLLTIHRNTVRSWLKAGLPTVDGKRPILILGREIGAFLQARRAKNKQTCPPGEIYCVRCRAPKRPAGEMADYLPINANVGNLRAICPDCESIIHRWVSMAKLGQFLSKMDITFPQALRHISERNQPTVNSDLK
jgi:hypothetical protein